MKNSATTHHYFLNNKLEGLLLSLIHISRRFVEKLLDWDMIDAIATDAHSSGARCVHMKEAWRLLKKEFGASYANELTDGHLLFDVPAE